MVEYIFKFYGESNEVICEASALCGAREVRLSITRIIERCKKQKITFENFFAQCISHEIIHILLRKQISNAEIIQDGFDGICSGKHMNFKKWRGGIVWAK